MTHDDDTIDWNAVPPAQMFHMAMQEVADTYKTLRDDIVGLDKKLTGKIDALDKKISGVASELHTLRIEVHQNQSAFIANQMTLEGRVTALEMAA